MIHLVVAVRNRINFTKNFLKSIENQSIDQFKIIIVDDGSTDGTYEYLKSLDNVQVIRGNGNLFWAESTNIAVKQAIDDGATHILTMNDDTTLDLSFMEQMSKVSKIKPAALIGCLAVDAESTKPIYAGIKMDWKQPKEVMALDDLNDKDDGLIEINQYCGRGLLIPVEVFNKIGFYDSKNFPQTIADIDFCNRAFKNGYSIFCNRKAILYTYPNESNAVKLRENKSISNFYKHLFTLHGAGNLIRFWKYAIKNCPRRFLVKYIIYGTSARIINYWLK